MIGWTSGLMTEWGLLHILLAWSMIYAKDNNEYYLIILFPTLKNQSFWENRYFKMDNLC